MKRFAEFWHASTGWNGKDFSGPVKLIPAVGDRSVLILDARNRPETQFSLARQFGEKHGHLAFRIMTGERFTDARAVTDLVPVTGDTLPHPVETDYF